MTTTHSDSLVALDYIIANPNKYDLIISDFVMPALNGVELFYKIVSTYNDKFSDFLIHSSMNPENIKSLIKGEYSPKAIVSKESGLDYISNLVSRYNDGKFF